MKLAAWKIDLKSLLMGVLLAAAAGLLFAGTSSQAQSEAIRTIAAGDGGVYILKEQKVYWKSKDDCKDYYGCKP